MPSSLNILSQCSHLTLHQSRIHTNPPRSVLHPHVFLLVLYQLFTASLAPRGTSRPVWPRSRSACAFSLNSVPSFRLLISQRSPRRLLLTHIEKETRRKIWWGLYSLDRML